MTFLKYVQTLPDNPYFGFGLFGLGAGATVLLRKGAQFGAVLFRRHYRTPCRDKRSPRYHRWLLELITDKGAKKIAQHISVETSFKQRGFDHVKTIKYGFIPNIEAHYIRYKGNWIKVDGTREQQTLDLYKDVQWETTKMFVDNKLRTIYVDKDNFEEAGQILLEKHEGKIYYAIGSVWRQFRHARKRRPLESVVLGYGISERIVNDCRKFIDKLSCDVWDSDSDSDREEERPYRGYLLHGPPGCGKSSYITALAGELERDICVLNLSERGMTDVRLAHLLRAAPIDAIILLEDIDAAFTSGEDSKEVKAAYDLDDDRVTFSGLLRCLDWVASTDAGRILFMTTNYLGRLDPALVSPGRVDVKEYIGWCSASQVEQMFLRFYKKSSSKKDLGKLANEFADSVMSFENNVSPAQIQEYFRCYKSDPDAAVENVPLKDLSIFELSDEE